jgi:hypothetical protein
VQALRAAGCSVQPLHSVGKGCPDLLCGVAGQNVLLEVKDGARPPSERRLTPDQKRWHADWKGRAHVVETIADALMVVDYYMRKRLTAA